MSKNGKQTFENHARFVPGYHYFLSAVLLLNLGNAFWGLFRGIDFSTVLNLLMAVSFIGLFWYLRSFPITVQDRVIRLEMRLRLREVLPAEMHSRIAELTPPQLVGLRFAGDSELPALVQEVLAGKLTNRTEIKKKVQEWQADHLRC